MTMPRRRHRGQTDEFKELAAERIERLFGIAEGIFKARPELADRYVRAAWRLKTKYNLRLPKNFKLKFCRKCLSFWSPGASCRVRVQSGRVIVTCLRCGRITRLPYGGEHSLDEPLIQPVGKALIPRAPKN